MNQVGSKLSAETRRSLSVRRTGGTGTGLGRRRKGIGHSVFVSRPSTGGRAEARPRSGCAQGADPQSRGRPTDWASDIESGWVDGGPGWELGTSVREVTDAPSGGPIDLRLASACRQVPVKTGATGSGQGRRSSCPDARTRRLRPVRPRKAGQIAPAGQLPHHRFYVIRSAQRCSRDRETQVASASRQIAKMARRRLAPAG